MNKSEFFIFVNTGPIVWRDVPYTWLECDNHGRIRDSRSKEWFGAVIRYEDFYAVLTGQIPVWDHEYVEATKQPRQYFDRRTEDDTQYNIDCVLLFSLEEINTIFERNKTWHGRVQHSCS